MLIDFSRQKALAEFHRKEIFDFERDIADFPGIVQKKTTPGTLKVFKDGKIKTLHYIAYATDNMGVFFCVTNSGERLGFEGRYVVVS